MEQLKCLLTDSDCYKTGRTIIPKGVMVHSTGADNPWLRRYVQPAEDDPNREALLKALGVNQNGNDWNRPGMDVGVHAFIGRLADGTVAAAQTLPWDHRGWHAGTGTSGGSANNTHISFEICEDDLTSGDYFAKIYRSAVELTAMLCKLYELDPLADGVVICHSEGYRRGIASGHADVEHWFPRFGKTMDDFRRDVDAELKGENDMTQEQFDTMLNNWLGRQARKAPSDWSAKERGWAEESGVMQGDGGALRYKSFATREEVAAMLYRLNELEK